MDKSIKAYLNHHSRIQSTAEAIFEESKKCKMFGLLGDEHYHDFTIEANNIDINWQVYIRGGGYETGSISVPLEAFCGKWRPWLCSKILKFREKTRRDKEMAENIKREAELRLLKELKAKYEG